MQSVPQVVSQRGDKQAQRFFKGVPAGNIETNEEEYSETLMKVSALSFSLLLSSLELSDTHVYEP